MGVELFVWAHKDVDTGVSLNTFEGRRFDAALVDGDRLWHAVQVDGTLQKSVEQRPCLDEQWAENQPCLQRHQRYGTVR